MNEFIIWRDAFQKHFDKLAKNGTLFVSSVSKDEIWNTYLKSFPEGTNPVFRERTEHDCVCCKQFIRNAGRVVAELDGKLVSVWDFESGTFYDEVAKELSKLNLSTEISGIFLNDEREIGRTHTFEILDDGSSRKWDHFHVVVPESAYLKTGIGELKGAAQTNKSVLKRSLEEMTTDSVDVVLELIEQNAIYRGEEHIKTVKLIKELQRELEKADNKELYLWKQAVKLKGVSSLRNTVIGTLIVDISEGTDLTVAVKKFEDKVAPHNYKRTTSLVTPKMKEVAKQKAKELGIEPSLMRVFAKKEDFKVSDVLFYAQTDAQSDSVFDVVECSESGAVNVKALERVTEIGIEKFIKDVLPNVQEMEVLFEPKHKKNLLSMITAKYISAPNLFKWNNPFSWTYDGDITDSDMRAAVKAKGGSVDGAFRFTHQWNYDKPNQSLMDLHVFMPSSTIDEESHVINDKYGNGSRVGWNNRQHQSSGGVQDVDYTDAAPVGYVPVENITFPDIKRMPEGKYICKIHNWNLRGKTEGGFKAEIEFGGQVFEYEYDKPLKHKEWVTVAVVTLKNGLFSIEHKLQPTNATSINTWGIDTLQFHKVELMMLSPNHWEQQIGNKHYIFALKDCKNPDDATGFYNEFLREDLNEHRKVFEHLSSSLKAPHSNEQVSGLGFSSTKPNELFVRVKGTSTSVMKVVF